MEAVGETAGEKVPRLLSRVNCGGGVLATHGYFQKKSRTEAPQSPWGSGMQSGSICRVAQAVCSSQNITLYSVPCLGRWALEQIHARRLTGKVHTVTLLPLTSL